MFYHLVMNVVQAWDRIGYSMLKFLRGKKGIVGFQNTRIKVYR